MDWIPFGSPPVSDDPHDVSAEWLLTLPAFAPEIATFLSTQQLEASAEALQAELGSRDAVLAASRRRLLEAGCDTMIAKLLAQGDEEFARSDELAGRLQAAINQVRSPAHAACHRELDPAKQAWSSQSVAPVRAVLAEEDAETKRAAINTPADHNTTVLGVACACSEGPVQQEVLRILLEEGGDPNQPGGNPVACYPITSTHSVGTLRQLVEHGARMDHPVIRGYLDTGHPTDFAGGKELRRYLTDDLGIALPPAASEE